VISQFRRSKRLEGSSNNRNFSPLYRHAQGDVEAIYINEPGLGNP
jgi:hypothetical protein